MERCSARFQIEERRKRFFALEKQKPLPAKPEGV
jgi:hypothetical protein